MMDKSQPENHCRIPHKTSKMYTTTNTDMTKVQSISRREQRLQVIREHVYNLFRNLTTLVHSRAWIPCGRTTTSQRPTLASVRSTYAPDGSPDRDLSWRRIIRISSPTLHVNQVTLSPSKVASHGFLGTID